MSHFTKCELKMTNLAALRAALADLQLKFTEDLLHQQALVWAAVVVTVWMLGAPNVFLGVHFNRYLLWAFPSLLVLVAVGLGLSLEVRLLRAATAVLVVLAALSTLRFALLYGEAAGEIARRDLSAARFISASLPAGAAIANVATSVEYLTGHRNLNLHGVTSPSFDGLCSSSRSAEASSTAPRAFRKPAPCAARLTRARYSDVYCRMPFTRFGVRSGLACSMRAIVPATTGAAMLVPVIDR